MTVLDQLAKLGARLDYRLVGTSSALPQGVPLVAGDVDILLRHRADVDTIAAALAPFPCRTAPVWLPDARQYFARYAAEDVDIEISTVERPTNADAAECVGAGPWRHYVSVPCGTHRVPAVRLELRLVSELVRKRPDRAAALTAHLRTHGADLGLLRQAMTDQGLAPDQQKRLLDELN